MTKTRKDNDVDGHPAYGVQQVCCEPLLRWGSTIRLHQLLLRETLQALYFLSAEESHSHRGTRSFGS